MAQAKHPLVQAADAARRLDAEQAFIATLVAVSGPTGQIQRNDGRGLPDPQFYAIAGSYAPRAAVGDAVLVMRFGAGYVIKDNLPSGGAS